MSKEKKLTKAERIEEAKNLMGQLEELQLSNEELKHLVGGKGPGAGAGAGDASGSGIGSGHVSDATGREWTIN
jgi:hypothetical protein